MQNIIDIPTSITDDERDCEVEFQLLLQIYIIEVL